MGDPTPRSRLALIVAACVDDAGRRPLTGRDLDARRHTVPRLPSPTLAIPARGCAPADGGERPDPVAPPSPTPHDRG